MASELIYAGRSYCFAFARFGTEQDALIVAEFREPWLHWTRERASWVPEPNGDLALLCVRAEFIAAQCAFADEAMALLDRPPQTSR